MTGTWPLVGRADELAAVGRALRGDSTRCVVLSGRPGVGKTRLAREVAAARRRNGWAVRWAIATEQTRAVPLGAVAPLLPGPPPEPMQADRFRLLGWAGEQLLARRPEHDLLVVDDAPLLDELTSALVRQLARAHGGTRLLLTVRTVDAPDRGATPDWDGLPDWLAALARDEHTAHVRLRELTEIDVEGLIESVVGGATDAATHALLWTHSNGNPLWLRQLVGQGLDSGALRRRDGVFRWDGPIGTGDLAELLTRRIAAVPPDEAAALELVALGEPLPADVARRLGIDATVRGLARRDLVERDGQGRIRLAHPLYGSATRDGLSALARSAAEQRLADAFSALGPPSGADLVRVARWRLDAADTTDPALLLAAAQRALLLDPALAERFARAACAHEPGYAALHVLGRSLFDQRRGEEADRIYEQLVRRPLSGYERVGVTLERAMFQAWTRCDPDAAVVQLRDAEARADFAPHAAVVAAMRAAVELFRGAPHAALDAALSTALDPAEVPQTRLLATLAIVPALTVLGRVDDALELAAWARTAVSGHDFAGPVPHLPTYTEAQFEWEYAFALRWAGRIDDAVAASAAALRGAAREPHQHPQSYGLLNAAAGAALLAAGNVREACGPLRVGAAALRASDANGTVVSCLADLARAEALGGDTGRARELLAEAAERSTPASRLFAPSVRRARAITAAMTGDLDGARTEARAGAQEARERGEAVLEAACLHLVVRFDDARAVADRLAELTESTDAALVSLFAAHAQAAAGADAGALERVADRFATAGALLLAAHAAGAAARTHRQAGRAGDAARAAHRSRGYAARCPGAPAPLLLVEPVALTARERGIAGLARDGLPNQQIAQTLALSVRTVESHLQHVYRKLGVRNRAELLDAPVE